MNTDRKEFRIEGIMYAAQTHLGKTSIRRIAPYDEQDYHYAILSQFGLWKIYRKGKHISTEFHDLEPEQVARKMFYFDECLKLKPKICHY